MSIDLWRRVASDSFYSSSRTEPSMRDELINTFDGGFPEMAKAQVALLRRMRKDSSGNKITCECVDPITHEPDKDRFCPICYAESYYWDEEELQIYRVLQDSNKDNATLNELRQFGLINVPIVVFYTRYDSAITHDDKIVLLALDTEGNVVLPYRRVSVYRINMAWDYRADYGRLEYWKIYAHLEDVKYLNPPGYENA